MSEYGEKEHHSAPMTKDGFREMRSERDSDRGQIDGVRWDGTR